MRIALFTTHPLHEYASPPSRLFYIGKELAGQGHQVRLVGAATDEPFITDNLDIRLIPSTGLMKIDRWIMPLRRQTIGAINWSDAVVVRGYWIAFWIFFFAKLNGKNIRIWDFHGFSSKELMTQGSRVLWHAVHLVEALSLIFSTHIMAVSKGTMAQLGRKVGKKTFILQNGVVIEKFRSCAYGELPWLPKSLAEDRLIVGIVAQFGNSLNPKDLLDAARLLKNKILPVFVGIGPSLDAAKKHANGIPSIFAGRIPHEQVVTFLVHHCDVCLAPCTKTWQQASAREYFSLRKIKEYAAAGKPVIISDVPGIESLLVPEKNCLVYEPHNSEDLAKKLQLLMNSPETMAKLKREISLSARTYDWQELCKQPPLFDIFKS